MEEIISLESNKKIGGGLLTDNLIVLIFTKT